MSKFNGMSQIELEMLIDEINKILPTLIAVAPTVVELTCEYYKEYKKQPELRENEAAILSVNSALRTLGIQ